MAKINTALRQCSIVRELLFVVTLLAAVTLAFKKFV